MLRLHVCKWSFMSLLAFGGAFGCVSQPLTKAITVPMPDAQGAGQLASVHKIAVMDITGPAPLGEVLATTVAARLASTGRFDVMDRPTIRQAGYDTTQAAKTGVSADMAKQVGLKVGADAVLVGEATISTAGSANTAATANDKTLLSVDYRLIDVKTGKVMLSQHESCVVDLLSLMKLNRVSDGMTPEEMRQAAANQFAEKVLARLSVTGVRPVPREFAVDPLAVAKDTLVSRGNRFAECGAFDEAEKLYMQAVREDHQCHQALYDLGLLAECAGNQPIANHYFQEAMRLNDCKLYIQAYQRTRASQG